MGRCYQIADGKDSRALAEFLAREGQVLRPLLGLLERSEAAVDEVIEVVGRATAEALLLMSAEEVAGGPPHPGRAGGEVRRHGRQGGVVTLRERKVRVEKPRLRRKGSGAGAEVEVPAEEGPVLSPAEGPVLSPAEGPVLSPAEGLARLRKQADWLEVEHPSAAGSLREGLEETFTVNRLGLPASLRRCLVTTNPIESSQSRLRRRTRRVSRWRDGGMTLRWSAAAFAAAEQRFRRIMGYRDLWILKAGLDASAETPAGNAGPPASTDDLAA